MRLYLFFSYLLSMVKLHFACGGNIIDGWRNLDKNCDIRKTLPFLDAFVDFIFIEHGIEHVTQREGLHFLKECHRILRIGGVLRIHYPDVFKCAVTPETTWDDFYHERGWTKNGARIETVNEAMFSTYFGHESYYSPQTMSAALLAAGFDLQECSYPKGPLLSDHVEMQGIAGHHKQVGLERDAFESAIVEAVR